MNQPKLEPSVKMNNGNPTLITANPNIVTTGIVQTPVNGNAQIGGAATTTMYNIVKAPTDQKPISVNATPLQRPQVGMNIIQAAAPNSSGISIAASGQPPIVIASTAGGGAVGHMRPMAPQQASGAVRIAAPGPPQQQIIIPRGAVCSMSNIS